MSVVDSEEIMKYMNEARTNPQKFAQYIKKDIDQFAPDGRNIPLKPGLNYQTNQGIEGWKQCYKFLKQAKPLPPYKLNKFMSLASQDHADDMSKNNFMGHDGSDGSTMASRLWKRCSKSNKGYQMGENIGGDFKIEGRNHALNTVKGLIIDDGVKNRGHRKNIFSQSFTHVGLGSSIVGGKIKVVMDFLNYEPSSSTGNNQFQQPKKKEIHYDEKNDDGFGFGMKGKGQNQWQGFGGHGQMQGFGQWKGMGEWKGENKGQKSSSGKYATSTETKTQTSTTNGKTVTKTIVKTKYSDGSTETKQTVSTSTKH